MLYKIKKIDNLPECLMETRKKDEELKFCKDDEYPGVRFQLEEWPTCVGKTTVAVYRPGDSGHTELPVFLYFHGGGWCSKSIRFLDDFCRKVVQNTGACVISPEYHLAPENPFPGMFYECYDIAGYIADHGKELFVDPERIVIGGDSAGGNLAAGICVKAAEDGKNLFQAHVLYYPALDLTPREGASENPDPTPNDSAEFFEYAPKAYIDGHDPEDPLISPVFVKEDTASRLPKLMLVTSSLDVLCAEGERYAIKLQQCGVEVTMRRQINGTHGTLNRKNQGYEETLQLTYRYLRSVLNL